MREIQLTQGKSTYVDDDDYDRLSQFKWHVYQAKNGVWYAKRSMRGNTIYMHREVLNLPIKKGSGKEVDHIDRNGLNNQKYNLREATRPQNVVCGRIRSNKSGYRGIRQIYGGKYIARIGVRGERLYIGLFNTAESAARAYDQYAIEIYGEFAVLNFP